MKQSLFGAGLQGKSVDVSSQRRVNLWASVEPIEDFTRIAFHGTPGFDTAFANLGATPIRGKITVNDTHYVVHRQYLYAVDNGGTATNLGTLNTESGRVSLAAGVDQVLIVDGTNGYVLTPSTNGFAQVSDGDFPNGATTATWQDGYFIVDDPSSNLFAISALDDATAWDAAEQASAEANPDPIVRVMTIYGFLFLLGPLTTESWANTQGLDFPYSRLSGGVIPRGLVAKWSATDFRDGIAGLFINKDGKVEVGVISGSGYSKISTQDIDVIFHGYSNKANATGLAYSENGHSFYQINFTSEDKSWIYDADSGLWSEVSSGNGRHRAEMADTFIGRTVISDYETGKLYRFDSSLFTEEGEPIIWTLISRHLYSETLDNPITALWLRMKTGDSAQDEEPMVMLRVSKDGGHSYGNEDTASMGRVGEYGEQVTFRRLGVAFDMVFEVRGHSSRPPVIMGEGWIT